MADRRVPLPAVDFPDMRLGRHVNHDPRSLRFLIAPPTARATPKSVKWERHVPPFQQGNLGTCVPNTGWGVLATDPYWDTLPREIQTALQRPNDRVQADLVLPLYREVTANDPFPGAYEPDDTGSDGLTLAKMLKARGLISGYQHMTNIAACHIAIQAGPFAIGVPWYNGMFYPDSNGLITISGAVVGGHEIMVEEYDLNRDWWWCTNSWDVGWGVQGRFAMNSSTFQTLLSRQGDATSFVPITAPAPTPTPEPEPAKPTVEFPIELMDNWAARTVKTVGPKYQRNAAKAYLEWRKTP